MNQHLKSKTPLVVFAYDRARHLEAMLESLAKCQRLDECDVIISSDGAKNKDDEARVLNVRHVAQKWAKQHKAKVIEQPCNLGLARSIIQTTTRVCEDYGRIIALEDDLLVGRVFLQYMLDALDKFEYESKVFQISGYMFPARLKPRHQSCFLPMVTTWGWATWWRAWRDVD